MQRREDGGAGRDHHERGDDPRRIASTPLDRRVEFLGDEIEVDFREGRFTNKTRKKEARFAPVPEALREIVELGGTTNWLRQWWEKKKVA